MGLDMRPMGKPKPGFEKRFREIFTMVKNNQLPQLSFLDKLSGKKQVTQEDLLKEWFANQIPSYETIKAPCVGKDKEADDWMRSKHDPERHKGTVEDLLKEYKGYYVIELSKETDAVPNYVSMTQDRNVFRGQFLADCTDLIGEELVSEAWETKLADETLDYGNRLMNVADAIAAQHNLTYLKTQHAIPENVDEESVESKLHIVYSLARWLIYYGKNGHGYEADY